MVFHLQFIIFEIVIILQPIILISQSFLFLIHQTMHYYFFPNSIWAFLIMLNFHFQSTLVFSWIFKLSSCFDLKDFSYLHFCKLNYHWLTISLLTHFKVFLSQQLKYPWINQWTLTFLKTFYSWLIFFSVDYH